MDKQNHLLSSDRDQLGLVKVRFPLAADDQAIGVMAENLWAEKVGASRYRIENSPFYAFGISYGDEIVAGEEDQRLNFRKVAARSGHSTYRILIAGSDGHEDENFKEAWQALAQLGCTYEVAKRRWLSIDVPALTNVFNVYRILEEGEEQGIWSFEEGHCGHTIQETTNQ